MRESQYQLLEFWNKVLAENSLFRVIVWPEVLGSFARNQQLLIYINNNLLLFIN